MGIRRFKPVTPTRRWGSITTDEEITKREPDRSLLHGLRRTGGRNSHGRITSRHRGGGHRRLYRQVDFRRDRAGVPARVLGIERDPTRSSHVALVQYGDGQRRYILSPTGLRVDQEIVSGEGAAIQPGNTLPLRMIPTGIPIHNVELHPGKGGQLVRSAGAAATIMAKEGDMAHVRLPSGEVRLIRVACSATVGQVGNLDHAGISLGKAGRTRWLGRRPRTRGVAKNPHDHPMGGGEGKSKGGNHPCSPWGQLSKGFKTRRRSKWSDRYIVRRRVTKRKGK